MKVRFGAVTFDGERKLLFREGTVVPLSPKAFHLLELLVTRRPAAVSKADIQEALWPRTFVSESNLPALVNEVRHALGQSGHEPGFVRTVHGFGYAFDADVFEAGARPEAAHRHLLLWGSHEMDLLEGENVVGRERQASIWIGHPSVSREHARITVAGAKATLEDLGSKNGTFRDGVRVTRSVPLQDGDELVVGQVAVTYRFGVFEAQTPTAG